MSKLADLQLSTGALKPFSFKHAKKDGSIVDVHVMLRVLTKAELDRARANAHLTVKALSAELREGKGNDDLLAEARTVEILAAACMDPDDTSRPWASPLEIAQTLHPGAIGALERAYFEHQEECGPFIRDLTAEQYEALVETIAQEASADPLALFATSLRNACVITMARELVSLRTEKSSRSSESSEPTVVAPASTDDLRESIGDVTVEVAHLRDHIASLTVRVMHLEGARVPELDGVT